MTTNYQQSLATRHSQQQDSQKQEVILQIIQKYGQERTEMINQRKQGEIILPALKKVNQQQDQKHQQEQEQKEIFTSNIQIPETHNLQNNHELYESHDIIEQSNPVIPQFISTEVIAHDNQDQNQEDINIIKQSKDIDLKQTIELEPLIQQNKQQQETQQLNKDFKLQNRIKSKIEEDQFQTSEIQNTEIKQKYTLKQQVIQENQLKKQQHTNQNINTKSSLVENPLHQKLQQKQSSQITSQGKQQQLKGIVKETDLQTAPIIHSQITPNIQQSHITKPQNMIKQYPQTIQPIQRKNAPQSVMEVSNKAIDGNQKKQQSVGIDNATCFCLLF